MLNAEGDKRHTGSRNGDVTDGKSSDQRAKQRKRDRREVERAVRDGTETGLAGKREKNAQQKKRDGGKERAGGTMLAARSKKFNQTT